MPEQIGKYRVDSVLGEGAMGVVYKAFDPHIERVVALKTIRKELLRGHQKMDLVARFRNEAQASGRLTHPNIVAVYDYGETEDAAFIAMEFVEGTPLNALLVPDQPTDLARVMVWMTQLLRALGYAHARGVVHRDIKPANLIITAEAQVKITDFGIARIESSTLTQTGSMIGTPSYMSPEQFRGAGIDGRSDVFSAGIVLYQLLTGVRPFVGAVSVVMQQILNENPRAPSQLNAVAGTAFDPVLRNALAKNPADRYASAELFLEALTQAYRQIGNAPLTPDGLPVLSDSDRTILASQIRDVSASQRAPVNQMSGVGLTGGQTGTSLTSTMTPWKLEVFPALEAVLSRQIGPLAKLLLKKAGARADDIDTLAGLLLAHVPSESGRAEFLDAVASLKKKSPGSTMMASAPSSGSAAAVATVLGTAMSSVPLDPAFIAAVETLLTHSIGAIAKVVVRRALPKCSSRDDFLVLISRSIESTSDRTQFLKNVAGLS
jgi:serine/threonine protein kinase